MKPPAPRLTALLVPVLALLTPLPPPAQAHNGQVALAYPLENIVVDGDLSDWPDALTRYSLDLTEYGLPPRDQSDLQATFRVGYAPGDSAIYVAVEVWDESVVVDSAAAAVWNSSDGCEVYLEAAHRAQEPIQHYVYGNHRSATVAGDPRAPEVAWQRGRGVHRYEWRLRPGQGTAVWAGGIAAIGFDVVVADSDEDGSFSWVAWGSGVGKFAAADLLGDLILVDLGGSPGEILGRVTLQGTDRGVGSRRVHLRSPASRDFSVAVKTDRDGAYHLRLPPGSYLVGLPRSAAATPVSVEAGVSTRVDLVVPPATGVAVTAGRGTVVEAGEGYRQGEWHSLAAPDGLAGAAVRCLLQGRRGYLWIGTSAGLSRFDGRRFTNFSVRDGLPSGQIRALAMAPDSALWIGTDAGLVRFDGWTFNTVSPRSDGGDQVRSVLVDDAGTVWAGIWGRGLLRVGGGEVEMLTSDDGLVDNQVRPVLLARDGSLATGSSATTCESSLKLATAASGSAPPRASPAIGGTIPRRPFCSPTSLPTVLTAPSPPSSSPRRGTISPSSSPASASRHGRRPWGTAIA